MFDSLFYIPVSNYVRMLPPFYRPSTHNWDFMTGQMCFRLYNHPSKHIKHMSHRMRKPTICIGENKGADQLRGNSEADQRLCFRYTDIQNFKLLACFCDCTGLFASDLVGNPGCWFSHAQVHICVDVQVQIF